jgi:hypothetical protein
LLCRQDEHFLLWYGRGYGLELGLGLLELGDWEEVRVIKGVVLVDKLALSVACAFAGSECSVDLRLERCAVGCGPHALLYAFERFYSSIYHIRIGHFFTCEFFHLFKIFRQLIPFSLLIFVHFQNKHILLWPAPIAQMKRFNFLFWQDGIWEFRVDLLLEFGCFAGGFLLFEVEALFENLSKSILAILFPLLLFYLVIVPAEFVLLLFVFLHFCVVPFYKPVRHLAQCINLPLTRWINLLLFVFTEIWGLDDGWFFLGLDAVVDEVFKNLKFVFNVNVGWCDKVHALAALL